MSQGPRAPGQAIESRPTRAFKPLKTLNHSPLRPDFDGQLITELEVKGDFSEQATGLVYDQRMTLHKHEWFSNEQEAPARIQRAFRRCQEEGLVMRCMMIPARPISVDALTLVHSRQYVRRIKETRSFPLHELYNFSGQFDGVFFNQSTWDSACLAVGSLKHLANLVVRGRLANGFAFLRPPGHHAMYAEACGYCVLNNVAAVAAGFLDPPPKVIKPTQQTCLVSTSKQLNKSVAAERLQHLCPVSNSPSISDVSSSSKSGFAIPTCRSKSTPKLERILIVDWDVHHGQGTQYTFYNDNRVLFVSIHRYERGTFWPNLREANFDFVGEGPGRGYNVNSPFSQIGLSDSDYLAIFHQLLMPIAIEFNPQLVLVSCGFDAAIGCPEGRMWLSPSVFGHFVHHLKILAGGKLVVALEGGYYVDSLAEGVVHVVKALLGDPPTPLRLSRPPSRSIKRTIESCIMALRGYWKSLWVYDASKTVSRPDLSQLSLASWPMVKRVVWPETNPLLPDQLKQYVHFLMDQYLPTPLSLPSCHLVLLLAPLAITANHGASTSTLHTPSTKHFMSTGNQAVVVAVDQEEKKSTRTEGERTWSEQLLHELNGPFHVHLYRAVETGLLTARKPLKKRKPSNSAALSAQQPIKRYKSEGSLRESPGLEPVPAGSLQKPVNRPTCDRLRSFGLISSCLPEFHVRPTCGCSFATTGNPYSKRARLRLPDLSVSLRYALNDLFTRKFSRVLIGATYLDPRWLLELVTDVPRNMLTTYRTHLFRTRTGSLPSDPLPKPELNCTDAADDLKDELDSLNEFATALLMRQATNQSNAMSTFDWTSSTPRRELLGRSGRSSQQNSVCNMSDEKQVCRVFAIDLSGEREPFTTKAGELYLKTPGLIQCDLLWCSIYRGSYAQQLANRPTMLRTVTQRHLINDSNQRIRSVQWLKLPVLDCSLPPSTSPSPEAGAANLLALLLHVVLPVAYEFGPELAFVQLGQEWTDTDDTQACVLPRDTSAFAHSLHLLNGLGTAVLVCLNSIRSPSTDLLTTLLGRPPHMNPNSTAPSIVPTPK
ncbi:uncharacterized protein DEA37_0004194 [Paragonimus westermani]|uniref:Histone deacetylase domain-containing protein n=1 Tax=Paragonimus westermani TaxID=34504 RepID=A0A5J4NVY2_9TREM|nr:uncharacterized protein DEA37_0004194 [Paragonimus westermani]